jgi:hypothetical protein
MRIIIPPFNDMKEIWGWRDSYLTLVPTTDESPARSREAQ